MSEPTDALPETHRGDGTWVTIRFKVPPAWKRWLDEAARVRATTVSEIIRQLIRELMIQRPR